MSIRFLISFVSAVLFASGLFAQDKSQPTVDELIAKNIEAKGGATTLKNLQTLRTTGKLLVPVQGLIELGYVQIKKAARRSPHRGFAPGHDADRGV